MFAFVVVYITVSALIHVNLTQPYDATLYLLPLIAADPMCVNIKPEERLGLGDVFPNMCLATGHCYDTSVDDINLRCFDRSENAVFYLILFNSSFAHGCYVSKEVIIILQHNDHVHSAYLMRTPH